MVAASVTNSVLKRKSEAGGRSYYSGLAAEDAVARHYERGGATIVEHRWRGVSGEIDLIARDANVLVFIEVKKGDSFGQALERVSPRQIGRIITAASEYLAGEPAGQNADLRFDVAMVDCLGRISILENAVGFEASM